MHSRITIRAGGEERKNEDVKYMKIYEMKTLYKKMLQDCEVKESGAVVGGWRKGAIVSPQLRA
jgi:hypothetical protein